MYMIMTGKPHLDNPSQALTMRCDRCGDLENTFRRYTLESHYLMLPSKAQSAAACALIKDEFVSPSGISKPPLHWPVSRRQAT